MPALRDILRRTGQMPLFRDVMVPAKPTTLRMTHRGMKVDLARLKQLRDECKATIERLSVEVKNETEAAWQARLEAKAAEVVRADEDIAGLFQCQLPGITYCSEHLRYDGSRKPTVRKKVTCEACDGVFRGSAARRQDRSRLVKARADARKKYKEWSAGGFDPENPNHWRWLLYTETSEGGLGLKAPRWARTPASKKFPEGQIKADIKTIEKLQLLYPEQSILTKRVQISHAVDMLGRELGVEPDENGRVHFVLNMHKGPRLASGTEDTDQEKARESAGNGQNIKKRARSIYVASGPERRIGQWDYSQIEGWITAWIADDEKVLALWEKGWEFRRRGEKVPDHFDIHCLAAAAIYGVEPAMTRKLKVSFEGAMMSQRDSAKRMRHGRNYGLGWERGTQMYGITDAEARRIWDADDRAWPKTTAWRRVVVEQAEKDRQVVDCFGLIMRLYGWKFDKFKNKWVTTEREEILACKPQRTAAHVIKAVLPDVELMCEAYGAELLWTVHDSIIADVPVAEIVSVNREIKSLMHRTWPQLGIKPRFGEFACPVDVEVGHNWGPKKCEENDNLLGLVAWEESEFAEEA